MFRDDAFSPSSYSPAPRSPPHSMPPSPTHPNNNNNFDDVFGSAPSSPTSFPAIAARGNNEPSDIPRLRSAHSTAGYRDGLTASKGTTIQEGFDEGYGLGATMGLRVGAIIGTLEGILSAAAKKERSSNMTVSDGNSGQLLSRNKKESEVERLKALVNKARNELRTEGVFGKEYWGSDGIWTYHIEEGEGGWQDVVDTHPLIRSWERTLRVEVDRVGLDTSVFEKTDVKRLGDDDETTDKI